MRVNDLTVARVLGLGAFSRFVDAEALVQLELLATLENEVCRVLERAVSCAGLRGGVHRRAVGAAIAG